MKFIVGFLIPLMFIPSTVFGLADLQNREIIAESTNFEDSSLLLEFGEYDYTNRGKPIPNLELGLFTMFGDTIELENPSSKIMGNSFVIKTNEIVIYARGMGNNEYLINAYLIDDNVGLTKRQFVSTHSSIIDINNQEKVISQSETEESKKVEMIILGRISSVVSIKEEYEFSIRVFNEELNPLRNVNQENGHIADVNVAVQIFDSDEVELWSTSGKTDVNGYYSGFLKIPNDNRLVNHEYSVKYTMEYQGNIDVYYDTFIIQKQDGDKISKLLE